MHTFLQVLNVSHNKITSLPEEIGDLTSLNVLNVRHNYIPYFPDSLSKLTLLKALDVSYNMLSNFPSTADGRLLLSTLSNLHFLVLNHNQIHGEVGAKIYKCLPNLEALHLKDNNISAFVAPKKKRKSFGPMKSLRILDLKNNARLKEIPGTPNLSC